MNGQTIVWGFVFIVILVCSGIWVGLWRQIFKSKWTYFTVEKVSIVSTGYLCTIKSKLSCTELVYFFEQKDIKNVGYYPGQGEQRMLTIKKAALKRRGLWQEGGKSPNLGG